MTARFYKIECPNNVLDKTSYMKSGTSDVTIRPYEPLDDLSGYIITSDTYDAYNYVEINMTGKTRYYFITNRVLETAGRCRIYLEEDTLMTWKDTIISTPCVVGRTGVGGYNDMGGDIPTMAYSIISDNANGDLDYGTLNELYYVVFSACSGTIAASNDSNNKLLPYAINSGREIRSDKMID